MALIGEKRRPVLRIGGGGTGNCAERRKVGVFSSCSGCGRAGEFWSFFPSGGFTGTTAFLAFPVTVVGWRAFSQEPLILGGLFVRYVFGGFSEDTYRAEPSSNDRGGLD